VGLLAVAAGDCLQQVRVALGAVAPVVLRARAAEAVLEGRRLDNEVITAAVAAALEEINPIDDVRASGWYRSELVCNLLTRVLRNAVAS
jgi:CO/xanthine dehydrogenase FAD-binding subunit